VATASEKEKNGIPRFAFTDPSIGSTTTWTSPPVPKTLVPSSSDTSTKSSSSAVSRATTASSAAWSIAVVSSPPSPRRTTGSRSTRVGSRSRIARTSSTQARQVSSHGLTA